MVLKAKTLHIFTDGGARGNPGPAAAAFIVRDEGGQELFKKGTFIGEATNNLAEYQALERAFDWLLKSGLSQVEVNFYLDSELVVRQLTGIYKIKNKNLMVLVQRIKEMERLFGKKIFYKHISREKNKEVDALVNQTLDEKT